MGTSQRATAPAHSPPDQSSLSTAPACNTSTRSSLHTVESSISLPGSGTLRRGSSVLVPSAFACFPCPSSPSSLLLSSRAEQAPLMGRLTSPNHTEQCVCKPTNTLTSRQSSLASPLALFTRQQRAPAANDASRALVRRATLVPFCDPLFNVNSTEAAVHCEDTR